MPGSALPVDVFPILKYHESSSNGTRNLNKATNQRKGGREQRRKKKGKKRAEILVDGKI